MSPIFVKAKESWQHWEDLRWVGLQQFSKGDLDGARKSFELALAQAKSTQPGGEQEATSTYDLAQAYEAEGKTHQAEIYCKRALELEKSISPQNATITLILTSMTDLKRAQGKFADVEKLNAEVDKFLEHAPDKQLVGAAEMDKDGTIKVEIRLDSSGNMTAHGTNAYAVTDPEYKKILMHIGPLKPGEPKVVAPLK